MMARDWLLPSLASALLLLVHAPAFAPACGPAPRFGQAVVNADQTVIILWDPATKTEHFIRQASFKCEADDFGSEPAGVERIGERGVSVLAQADRASSTARLER